MGEDCVRSKDSSLFLVTLVARESNQEKYAKEGKGNQSKGLYVPGFF